MTADEIVNMAQQAGYPHVGLRWNDQELSFLERFGALAVAADRAVESEVRKDDEALIRQLVAALEGYRRNHNDTQPCDAEREGRAWLEGKPCA